jgi:hypothetical protein
MAYGKILAIEKRWDWKMLELENEVSPRELTLMAFPPNAVATLMGSFSLLNAQPGACVTTLGILQAISNRKASRQALTVEPGNTTESTP